MAYDLSTLPSLGRNGVRQAVHNISGMVLSGWRDIDASATFLAGQLAKLGTDSKGNVVVQAVSGTGDKPVGIFVNSNTTTFYRPIVKQPFTVGAASSTFDIKPYVLSGSFILEAAASGTDYTVTTNYTVNLTNGVVTNVNITEGTAVLASYRYKDINLSGINQVLGSGKAALLENNGELSTLVYDTSCAWTLNASVYFTAGGLLTSTSGSSAIGYVSKAPTYSDPRLNVVLALI